MFVNGNRRIFPHFGQKKPERFPVEGQFFSKRVKINRKHNRKYYSGKRGGRSYKQRRDGHGAYYRAKKGCVMPGAANIASYHQRSKTAGLRRQY